MLITIKSFNGFTLNNTDYFSAALRVKSPPDANVVFLEQAKADSMYSGTFNINVRSVPVGIKILDSVNLDQLEGELKEALRPGTRGTLVATFQDDGRDYELDCVVQSLVIDPKYQNCWQVIFQSGDSTWKTVSEVTESWDITASGDEKEITVGGYSQTRLSLQLTASQLPATGWAYQKLYLLPGVPSYNHGLRPWCITVDTAALVTAGKMQADGDDIRMVVDGKIVNRWLADMNTDHTKIWFNVRIDEGLQLTLNTAIAASGDITEMDFQRTDDNVAAFNALPERGFLQHGTEWFEYTAKGDRRTVTISTRGAFETNLQAHNVGDTFNWVQHSIFWIYGNSSIGAPSLGNSKYDDTKPVFDLSASSNTTWVYTAATKFYDADKPGRTGAWKFHVEKEGDVSELYYVKGDAETGDPAMGMQLSTWLKNGAARAEKATLSWQILNAGNIQEVSSTGRKYRSTASWPGSAAIQLQRSNGGSWKEVWSSPSPSTEDTWETITKTSQAVSPAMSYVRFCLSGSLGAVLSADCYFEILTASVVFVSANQPSGSLGSEKSNLLLDVQVENQTNGDAINLLFPMRLNKSLIVDGEDYEVTYAGVNAHGALTLEDESREVWIRLNPGVNDLKITGENVGALTASLRWLVRRL